MRIGKDMDGKYICPYNNECRCTELNCEKCGWYPPVAEKRMEEAMRIRKYKIPFTGYCEVWAKSPEEASKKADNGEMFFVEYDFGNPTTDAPEEDEEVSE